jgi:hypothetical protein
MRFKKKRTDKHPTCVKLRCKGRETINKNWGHGSVTETCLAPSRPWVGFPALGRKEEEKETGQDWVVEN